MKLSRKGKRGGRRENAGRKATWNNLDTMTIRVPKVIAATVMEFAHRLDSGEKIDLEIKPNCSEMDKITESNVAKDEKNTTTIPETNESVTNSIMSLNEAIEFAKKTLKHKKSACKTVADLISKIYSTSIGFEDLK